MARSSILRVPDYHRSSGVIWQRLSNRLLGPTWLALVTLVLVAIASGPVFAEVKLRVEARPITDPINVFVTVTNGDNNGTPVAGLTDQDFTVLVDGEPVLTPVNFSLSPIQDEQRRVAVIFAMDYSSSVSNARAIVEGSVTEFLNNMQIGDYAGIIKFNSSLGAQLLPPLFVEIADEGVRQALIDAVGFEYSGLGSPVYEAVKLAVEQFKSTTLPAGPKAIVVVSDGFDNDSSVTGPQTATLANDEEISIFSVAVGDPINLSAMTELAFQTGGQFYLADDDDAIESAYGAILTLLQNEYLLTFDSSITDCNVHVVEVQVTGFDPATSTFTRCTPSSTSPTPVPTPPPEGDVGGTPLPPPSDDGGQPSDSGGGGGGGAFGPLGLIAGLSLLAMRRRIRLG